ncbi:MAG: DUF1801 domain-containing protein [Micrococcales bacterium]|nr:DUF1801 domain-containing protein [Micrococcales bacterium]
MKTFEDFLAKINSPEHREKLCQVLDWVTDQYPQVKTEFKWNKPTFTVAGTYIVAFDAAKNHFSLVDPEHLGIEAVAGDLDTAGLSYTAAIVRIPWDKPVPYEILKKLIEAKLAAKDGVKSFWLGRQATSS